MLDAHHTIQNDADGNPWHVIDATQTTRLGRLIPAANTRIEYGPMCFEYQPGQTWCCTIQGEHVKTFVGSIPPAMLQALDKAGFTCSQVFGGFLQPLFMRVQTGAMVEGEKREQHRKYKWLIPDISGAAIVGETKHPQS